VSFGHLSPTELGRLVAISVDRSSELWGISIANLVLNFENRGGEAVATLAHPHGQIYAFDHLPPITAKKANAHTRYRQEKLCCARPLRAPLAI
jgi:UDPglucose--hexose-1-phosphate uridylyltransferase